MNVRFITVLVLPVIMLISCESSDKDHQYTGIIEGTVVKIPALSGGQIMDMYVDLGDEIALEQPVALVDSTELSYQRQQLLAGLRELEAQTKIAETNIQRNMEDKSYIQTRYNRIAKLYEAKSVPQQDYDDVKNQLEKVNTAVLTAQQQLQSLSARKAQIQAQIDLLNKKINDTIIKSPVNGIITAKYYEKGEAIPPMQPVVEVTDISQVDTKIYISESLLAQLSYNQEVKVEVDGLKDSIQGKITWISPKAEFTPKNILTPETRTTLVYAVRITINNSDKILKHGMPVVIYL